MSNALKLHNLNWRINILFTYSRQKRVNNYICYYKILGFAYAVLNLLRRNK